MRKGSSVAAGLKKDSLWQSICKHKGLYLMALPGFIWFVLFKYVPLAGAVIAFMDYDIYKGSGGIFTTLLSPNTGVINNLRQMLGLDSCRRGKRRKRL